MGVREREGERSVVSIVYSSIIIIITCIYSVYIYYTHSYIYTHILMNVTLMLGERERFNNYIKLIRANKVSKIYYTHTYTVYNIHIYIYTYTLHCIYIYIQTFVNNL